MHFFSEAKTVPASVVAMYIGLMPNWSRARNSFFSLESHTAKANMPRRWFTTSAPQWWKPTTMVSPSPSVLKV